MIPTSTQEERNTPANKPMEQKFGVQPQELAVTDISKFFQQVFVRKSSYPLQFLVWRKVGNPNNPLAYYTITRLTYGHKSASTLAKMSLEMITEYGEDRCEMSKRTLQHHQP